MDHVSFGIYHGDEDWVLKGIGQDLASSLALILGVTVQTTDAVFKGVRLKTDFHIFVQQGQLNENCKLNNGSVPNNSICLFTHLDVSNFNPKVLSKCRAVVFNSSIQLSMAIANGYNPTNSYLLPHAVDPSHHRILSSDDNSLLALKSQLQKYTFADLTEHSAVGFCGRYWDKHTYIRRKNYQKVKDVALSLANSGIPVIVLGPNWDQLFDRNHQNILLLNTRYANYPPIYNLMKIFVSLSIHEGGPLPVLESMCCGAYPIVTNTGFAFDVLNNFSYSDLIDPFIDSDKVCNLIKDRFFADYWDKQSIRKHASKFSFKSLANLMHQIALKSFAVTK